MALGAIAGGTGGFCGVFFLVIPGWIISGILMFTLPLVVDERFKAVDAISASGKTLKDQWLIAAVFALVLFALQLVGLLFCGMGFLVTLPLSVLSHAILYRGFFPRPRFPRSRLRTTKPTLGRSRSRRGQKGGFRGGPGSRLRSGCSCRCSCRLRSLALGWP